MTSTNQKYKCPECGSTIHVYEEYYFEKRRKVDPHTGKLGRLCKTEEEVSPYLILGLACNKCNWGLHWEDAEEGSDFNLLLKSIETLDK